MLAVFLKFLALVTIFDVFALCVFGAFRHSWLPFRVACAGVASVCIAALVAVAVS